MKKEAIITIIIIILILAGEWITQNYTNKKLSKLQEDLSSLKEEILAENDVDTLIQKTEDTFNIFYYIRYFFFRNLFFCISFFFIW